MEDLQLPIQQDSLSTTPMLSKKRARADTDWYKCCCGRFQNETDNLQFLSSIQKLLFSKTDYPPGLEIRVL